MLLYLFRHGIAIDRTHPDCPSESERFLTERGQRSTHRAARGLRHLRVRPDLVLTSPYVRARETAEIVLRELDLAPMRLHVREDLLPMSPPESVLAALPELHEQDVMLVGHAPHLDALLAEAVGHDDPYLSSLTKAGAACIEFDDSSCRRGTLLWLIPSRGLRAMGRGSTLA